MERVAVHTFRHIARENSKACSVLFEPGAHHLPICTSRAPKSMARRLRHATAKHADRQHRASQRCIFIAPELKAMERILNASPPVRPATSRALGTLHDEGDSKPAECIRLPIALRAASEAKSARRRMETLAVHEVCARQARRSQLAWQTAIRLD